MLVVVQISLVVTFEPPQSTAPYPAQFCSLRSLLDFWTKTSLLFTLPSHTLPSLSYFFFRILSLVSMPAISQFPYLYSFHIHYHHVPEGLGMLSCSLILKMKLVPPSLSRSSYVSSSFCFIL